MNQLFGERFNILEKVRYCGQLLLKLRPVEVATSFHWISSRSTSCQAHKNSSKLDNAIFWRLLSKEMPAKSLKVSGLPTTKWWPCKIFSKLTKNHVLTDNVFKLHKYQTFGLMKMHTMCKIGFANNICSLLRWNKKYFS